MGKLGVLFGFFMLFCGNQLRAGTITVCNSCEVKTIKEGIAMAADFDTLLVKKGTYKEFNIRVNKPLSIICLLYTSPSPRD